MNQGLILVVSLERDAHRWANVKRELHREGLAGERLLAVDAKTLSEQQVTDVQSKSSGALPIGPGEVACFLSHMNAWRRAIDNPEGWTLILEDDARLGLGSGDVIRAMFSGPEAGLRAFDIIRGETVFQFLTLGEDAIGLVKTSGVQFRVRRLLSNHGGTAGYFIGPQGAGKALAFAERRCEPADIFLFHPELGLAREFDTGQIEPAPIVQDYLYPDVGGRYLHASNLNADRSVSRRLASNKKTKERKQVRAVGAKLFREVSRPFKRLVIRIARFVGFEKSRKVAFLDQVTAGKQ